MTPVEFWELSLYEVNLIASGHEDYQDSQDLRMRKGWLVQYRIAGVKGVKESQLWPLKADARKLAEVKRRNIEEYDNIRKFAELKGKPKE